MKSVDEVRLSTLRQSSKRLKAVCKFDKFRGRIVLNDVCGYWKTCEPTGYSIVIQCGDDACHWHIGLVYSVDEDVQKLMVVRNALTIQVEKVVEDLWMTVQHLFIDEDDERNVAWDFWQAQKWWEEKEADFKIDFYGGL